MEDRLRRRFVPLFLVVATVAVFGQVTGFEFLHLDDDSFVSNNPMVARGVTADGLRWAFTSLDTAAVWHPLVWLSHMLDVELFGMNAGAHHRTNLVLHVANVLLLYAFWLRCRGGSVAAGFVAALFALHPLRVESVAWIIERKDVLSGFFFLLTLLAYRRWVVRGSRLDYGWALLAFAAGLTSKAMLVTVPLILLLLDVWPFDRVRDRAELRRRLVEKVPFVLLAGAASLLFARAQPIPLLAEGLGWGARLAQASAAYLHYLGKTFWPTGLAVFYPAEAPAAARVLAGAGLVLGVSALAFVWRRRFPFLAVGWFWFVAMLAPVSGILQVGRAEVAADRYTYLPSIGLAIVAVEIGRRARPRALAASVGAAVLIACGVAAHRQAAYWRDSATLFERTLELTEGNALIHFNYAAVLTRRGRVAEAVSHYEEALRIDPDYPRAHDNLGLAYLERGDLDRAEAHFRAEIARHPTYAPPHVHLGVTRARAGDLAAAREGFLEAARLDPELADAHYNLGLAALSAGRPRDAIEPLGRALLLTPDCADCALRLAEALARAGERERAVAVLRELLRRSPGDPAAAAALTALTGE